MDEVDLATDPTNPDTDGGGRNDGNEILLDSTNPLDPGDDKPALWISQQGGLWEDPSNWSGGELPDPVQDVIIDVPGDVTITHSSGHTQINSLTGTNKLVLTGGTLDVATVIRIDNSIIVEGVFGTSEPATLKNATIETGSSGHPLILRGAPSDNIRLDSLTLNVDVEVTSVTVKISSGLTLNSSMTVNGGVTLVSDDTQTIDGIGTILFEATSFTHSLVGTGSTTLTLGPDLGWASGCS